MKVLLINPPTSIEDKPPIPPLGIAYIAAVLEQHNIEVKIIDLDLQREQMRALPAILKNFEPDIVGISGLTLQMDNLYKIAGIAKNTIKNVTVVIGGPHPSALPERSLIEARGNVDIAVMGEGEYTFLDIVEGREWSNIPGIAFIKNSRIIRNERRKLIEDLDFLPFPARHLLNINAYPGWGPSRGKRNTHIIASRGCPFNCIFCSEWAVFGRKHRRRKPIKVVEEIETLINDYKIEEVVFYDDLFTLNKKWVMDICNLMISRNLNISWMALAHPNTVDIEMLEKMKKAGCRWIFYGFESGSDRILKNIKKHLTVAQSLKAAEMTRKVGIKIGGFFMIGNIGETKETIYQTINLVRRIEPDYYGFSIVRPDPGSEQYNLYKEKIEQKPISWANYYAFPRDLKNTPPIVGTALNIKQLLNFRSLAYIESKKEILIHDFLRAIIRFDFNGIATAGKTILKWVILLFKTRLWGD